MSIWINPPVFSGRDKYERFKKEVLAWREITEFSEDKQGIVIALSLPENDEFRIREKVFDEIQLEKLKSTNGLSVLLQFMDRHLAKDDLTDSWDKFKEFENFRRPNSKSIMEYIAEFDSRYRKIEMKNITLPPEILAFKLLQNANITREENMLVMTGMDYENKSTLYDQAKKSLKKFKGNNDMESYSNGLDIRLEPSFLEAHEETILAAGYSRIRGRDIGCCDNLGEENWKVIMEYSGKRGEKQSNNIGYSDERGVKQMHYMEFGRDRGIKRKNTEYHGVIDGKSGENNGDHVVKGEHPSIYWGDRSEWEDNRKSLEQKCIDEKDKIRGFKKKANPKGRDGRRFTCHSCGSFRHLLSSCPDSWENMERLSAIKYENMVLYTGNEIGKKENGEQEEFEISDIYLKTAGSNNVGPTDQDLKENYVSEKDKIQEKKTWNYNGDTCTRL